MAPKMPPLPLKNADQIHEKAAFRNSSKTAGKRVRKCLCLTSLYPG
eukprot:CAMPEP_0179032526 /NCGR_PEP_ID=MMETSP0796-20121207/11632_1 /TAXON_ID=73915 /ORGANISM="Pyrodinium bahamense, Strain pbaha01" /LENGTH=45 /DNA_ID= /DNA_START= /DNA_END= /DNA_ORIENTATION=